MPIVELTGIADGAPTRDPPKRPPTEPTPPVAAGLPHPEETVVVVVTVVGLV